MQKRVDRHLFPLLVCSFYGESFSAIRVKLENRLAANQRHNMRITRTFFCFILLTSSLLFVSCGRKSKEKLYQELLQETAQLQAEGNLASEESLASVIGRLDLFITEHPKNAHVEELRQKRSALADQRDRCRLFHIRNQYELITSDIGHPLREILENTQQLLLLLRSSEVQYLLNKYPNAKEYEPDLLEFRDEIQAIEAMATGSYSSLKEFNEEVEARQSHFEQSRFSSIPTLWEKHTDAKRKKLINMEIERAIDSIMPALEHEASVRTTYNHKHYKVKSIELISKTTPTWVSSPVGMICEATFRVNMVGAWFGIDRGTAKVSVKGGVFQTDSMGSIAYRILDHSELETTGDL